MPTDPHHDSNSPTKPPKRGRGRPRLSAEEKARRAELRKQNENKLIIDTREKFNITSINEPRVKLSDKQEIVHTDKGNRVVIRDETGKIIRYEKNDAFRPTDTFTDLQKNEFLKMIEGGAGRALALKTLGKTFAILNNTFNADDDFKQLVILSEASRTDNCELHIYNSALDGNLGSCAMYIKLQSDKSAQKRSLSMQKRELKLKEKALAKSLGTDAVETKMNFAALGDAAWNDFTSLHDKVKQGIQLSEDEQMMYGYYIAKMMNPKNANEKLRSGETRQLENFSDSD